MIIMKYFAITFIPKEWDFVQDKIPVWMVLDEVFYESVDINILFSTYFVVSFEKSPQFLGTLKHYVTRIKIIEPRVNVKNMLIFIDVTVMIDAN